MTHIKNKLLLILAILRGKPVMYNMKVVIDDNALLTFDEMYGIDENRGGRVQDVDFYSASQYYGVNYNKENE